jgi:hypothetical protein
MAATLFTPITNLIASLLSSNGNPDQLAAQAAGGASISQATLSAKTLAVQSTLKTVLNALNVGAIDPIGGTFSAFKVGSEGILLNLNVVDSTGINALSVAP